MYIKQLIDEDFVNYKKPSMVIGFPYCSMKCDKECGLPVCQNSTLANSQSINVRIPTIVNRYLDNQITKAIVFQGMEPFDSWPDILELVAAFREKTDDDIVIYTGYKKEEIKDDIEKLRAYKNIIVKFGRFVPNQEPHYDEVLGVKLASDNQFAERIDDGVSHYTLLKLPISK